MGLTPRVAAWRRRGREEEYRGRRIHVFRRAGRGPLVTAPELVDRLRAALVAAGYTYDGVAGALGPEALAALSRNETVPGLRRTAGGSPLETLTRLFLLTAATWAIVIVAIGVVWWLL